MQATEALCHLSVTDIKKTFCKVWFFCKNEACANCTGWNATTAIWLLTVMVCLNLVFQNKTILPDFLRIFPRWSIHAGNAWYHEKRTCYPQEAMKKFMLDNSHVELTKVLKKILLKKNNYVWHMLMVSIHSVVVIFGAGSELLTTFIFLLCKINQGLMIR